MKPSGKRNKEDEESLDEGFSEEEKQAIKMLN